jgi:hypothetical protein
LEQIKGRPKREHAQCDDAWKGVQRHAEGGEVQRYAEGRACRGALTRGGGHATARRRGKRAMARKRGGVQRHAEGEGGHAMMMHCTTKGGKGVRCVASQDDTKRALISV